MPAADAARALGPHLRAASNDIERERRLPPHVVKAMTEAGFFRLCVPRSLGGLEADVATLVGVLEELSRADASAGWCAMIGATSGMVAAYLPEADAKEIYGDHEVVTGGVFAPRGRAVRERDGYRVSGRWPFASGCGHCAWLMGGCVVEGGDGPRMMIFPASDVTIIDTWTVSGLCGTGSNDIEVSDVFVPEGRSVSLMTDSPREPGPLYRFPPFGLLALGIAAVGLGIARAAIEELVALAGHKTPTGSSRGLGARPAVQAQVARAEAMRRSARAFLLQAIDEAWQAAVAGDITVEGKALLRLAATNAATSSAAAVDMMYEAGGGGSIYATSPLQQHFRDVHALTQHMMVASPTYELTGRLLLGLETDTAML